MTDGAGGREDRRLRRAVREHRAALAATLQFVEGVPPERWSVSPRADAWSPAQVTEHLALAYDGLLHELEGGSPMASRAGAGWQRLLRWFLLPHMLFHRSMPRVRAPLETLPAGTAATPAEGAARLREAAGRAEVKLLADPSARFTHPYFGPLDRAQTLRLAALHLEHHQRAASLALSAEAALSRSSGRPAPSRR